MREKAKEEEHAARLLRARELMELPVVHEIDRDLMEELLLVGQVGKSYM